MDILQADSAESCWLKLGPPELYRLQPFSITISRERALESFSKQVVLSLAVGGMEYA